jgi:hypothetical protein
MRNCVGGFFLNVAGRPEFPVLIARHPTRLQ